MHFGEMKFLMIIRWNEYASSNLGMNTFATWNFMPRDTMTTEKLGYEMYTVKHNAINMNKAYITALFHRFILT